MKKGIALLLILVVCLTALNGCAAASYLLGRSLGAKGTATAEPTRSARPDKPSATRAATPEPDATTAATADPGTAGEDWQPAAIRAYFERVGFCDAGDSGRYTVKWTSPILVEVVGQPNGDDLSTLEMLISQFQQVDGMPSVSFVESGGNVRIGYLPKSRGTEIDTAYNGEDGGHVFIGWDDYNSLTYCNIIIADEMTDQIERDSNLIGFLFRGLGLAEDPNNEYPDSILNFSEIVASPSSLDWMMVMLLYNGLILPGMSPEEAMPVVYEAVPDGAAAATATPADDLTTEAMLAYFNEIGFFRPDETNEGVVLKWGAPITMQVVGAPSEAERQMLNDYVSVLNSIEGFPGITEVSADGAMVIYFQPHSELMAVPDFANMTPDHGSFYWIYWDDAYSIYRCSIAVDTTYADPTALRGLFLNVFYCGLGFLHNESTAYADSILNPDTWAEDWSSMDWAMAALLYNGAIAPGAAKADVMNMLYSGQ